MKKVCVMTLNQVLTDNQISKYRLSKNSGVPYMTINDICKGKTNMADCSAKTIYKIARELRASMEELIESYLQSSPAFEMLKAMCAIG